MLKAVLFDLDGVLVTTDMLHYKAWKQLADNLNIIDYTFKDNERQRGISRMESLEVVLNKSDKQYNYETKCKLANKKNKYYKQLLKTVTPKDVLPGALETLKMLKENSILIGLGSVSKNAPEIIRRTELGGYFDAIVCGEDIKNSKPDPEVFLVVANRLKQNKENCLVVEDADSGVEAGKRAGMKVLAVGAAKNNKKADFNASGLNSRNINWKIIKQSFSKNT